MNTQPVSHSFFTLWYRFSASTSSCTSSIMVSNWICNFDCERSNIDRSQHLVVLQEGDDLLALLRRQTNVGIRPPLQFANALQLHERNDARTSRLWPPSWRMRIASFSSGVMVSASTFMRITLQRHVVPGTQHNNACGQEKKDVPSEIWAALHEHRSSRHIMTLLRSAKAYKSKLQAEKAKLQGECAWKFLSRSSVLFQMQLDNAAKSPMSAAIKANCNENSF